MKLLILSISLLFLSGLCYGVDVPIASDNCTRANGAIGANWTVGEGTWSVSNNTCIVSASAGNNEVAWTHDAFANNQYSKVTVAAWLAGKAGPAVRVSGKNGYLLLCQAVTSTNCTQLTLYSVTNGTSTNILNKTGLSLPVASGLELQVVGNTLFALSGANVIIATADFTYTTGSAGMGSNGIFTSTNGVTSWSGGNVTGGELLRPTADSSFSGSTLNCGSTTATNAQTQPLFYDASGVSTSSTFTTSASGFGIQTLARVVNTWASSSGTYSELALVVNISSTAVNGDTSEIGVDYSINGGSTWTNLFASTNVIAEKSYGVVLSSAQVLSSVWVRVCGISEDSGGGGGNTSTNDYDVWTEGILNSSTKKKVIVVN